MKRIYVTHVSPSCDVVSGHGSRDLVMKILVRTPVFAAGEPRGWVMQPHRLPDLLALAADRGYDVVVTGTPESRSSSLDMEVRERRDVGLAGRLGREVCEADRDVHRGDELW